MKEDFLHYIWKFKKFDFLKAETSDAESLRLIYTGLHNQNNSGPDFFNAKLQIGEQLWAGNVEIHLKSSDWYSHQHEQDPAYDNVILHVVWEHDVDVFRKDNTTIPTLVLKERVHENALKNYQYLLSTNENRWVNCEYDFHNFTDFDLDNWLERLYIERLEKKSKIVLEILKKTTNDWEATLFCMLAKNFGLNINGEAFLSLALSIPFHVIRKIHSAFQMEALLFGQVGLLQSDNEDKYFHKLQSEYAYLRHKFNLDNLGVLPVSFFRLRPQNFPTIRLSQLANLLCFTNNLFGDLIAQNDLKEIRSILKVTTSKFWETHYTFKKSSKSRKKKLSKDFVDLVLINTIVPLKFCYMQHCGKMDYEQLFDLMRQLPAEKNSITKGFNDLRPKTAENALDSQALIELKKNYCDKNHCLRCNLGLKLLQNK